MLLASASDPSTYLNIPQIIALLLGMLGTAGGTGGILYLILSKKLRTPADRQAEIEFGVKVLQEALADSRGDKKTNEETIRTLREYATKLEGDSRTDQELIIKLYKQIGELEDRNTVKDKRIRELEQRLHDVATKLSQGIPITLADLLGGDPRQEEFDRDLFEPDTENTQIR